MIGRIILGLVALALAGFMALSLIGFWGRYSQETAASGSSGIYQGHPASQANFRDGPEAYRAAAEVDHRRQTGNVVWEATALEE